MYAIFETGGKQYTAKVGDVLFIEKLNAEVDETVTFEKVLAVGDDTVTFGTPYVEGMTVACCQEGCRSQGGGREEAHCQEGCRSQGGG